MGKRTVDTTQCSRNMTHDSSRTHLQERFGQLPLEIVCAVVTFAARDSISAGHPQWVAQCLAVVCNIFRDAVEPVLVESVWIWQHTNFDNVRPGRFAGTKHVYIADPIDFPAKLFPSLQALTGSVLDVRHLQRVPYDLPPRLTLRYYTDAWTVARVDPLQIEAFHGVTHLRIKAYSPHECPLELLPASVTHLVLTLARWPKSGTVWGDDNSVQLENQITHILSNTGLRLARVLVCLDYLQPDVAVTVLAHLHQAFRANRDARLWVDMSNEAVPIKTSRERELLDPAQTIIWYTGRPLHAPLPPP
ncbi:hypothetical protein EXIGLDRAFT_726671 [Exidia glandulosa HHB12029]|uniref:Uncharacterized protein n=1 Tax=Exidia glandulosa HHB12029 TaxID=1314781 RepID=A0A165DLP8_EXIGL|nr:hypothetical protein EXIGLDRAFT_726671 [Exidia glandulosa HHB12029]